MSKHNCFRIVAQCCAIILCLMVGVLAILHYYQQKMLSEMENSASRILRGMQVQLSNFEVEDIRSFSNLKTRRGTDEAIVHDPQKKVGSSIQPARTPLLELGAPDKSVIHVSPSDDAKVTAHFQTYPLIFNQHPIGYVRIALAIAPQTNTVTTVQRNILHSLLVLFAIVLVVLSYCILRFFGRDRFPSTTI